MLPTGIVLCSACLTVVSHPGATRTFRRPSAVRPLPPVHTTRIGRAPDNDLVVEDLIVSRRHAELRAVQRVT